MADNAYGIDVPAGTNPFDPDGDMRGMADGDNLGSRVWVPVANIAARDALEAAHGTPTAAKPLHVLRADAPVGAEHEYTTDGITWRTLRESTGLFTRREQDVVQSIPNDTLTVLTNLETVVESGAPVTWAGGTATVTRAGLFECRAQITYASNATGRRHVGVQKNGTSVGQQNAVAVASSSTSIASPTTKFRCDVGDTITFVAYQNSGAALNTVITAAGSAGLTHIQIEHTGS